MGGAKVKRKRPLGFMHRTKNMSHAMRVAAKLCTNITQHISGGGRAGKWTTAALVFATLPAALTHTGKTNKKRASGHSPNELRFELRS